MSRLGYEYNFIGSGKIFEPGDDKIDKLDRTSARTIQARLQLTMFSFMESEGLREHQDLLHGSEPANPSFLSEGQDHRTLMCNPFSTTLF